MYRHFTVYLSFAVTLEVFLSSYSHPLLQQSKLHLTLSMFFAP